MVVRQQAVRRRPPIPWTRWLLGLLVVVVAAVACVNFFVGLGGSSLFVDEAFSWSVASHPIGDLYAAVKLSEVAPPGFYALLHAWLRLSGSITEWSMRLPSALAGLGVVAATAWLGRLIEGRRVAITAGLLVAASPLLLSYAQQVRAYVFVMLATTLAVAAAISAAKRPETRGRRLVLSAGFAVAAIWLHYTCLPVMVPLAVWIACEPALSRRWKVGYVSALLLAQVLVTPLLVDQASTSNPGVDRFAHLTLDNSFAVLGNPVASPNVLHLWLVVTASVAVGIALVITVVDRPRDRVTLLVVACALLPAIALFLITAVVKPVLVSRYCTVATPFAVTLVAVAFVRRPRFGALPAAALAVVAVIGSVMFHEPGARWPDLGGAMRAVGTHWRPRDEITLLPGIEGTLTSAPLLQYYQQRYLQPGVAPLVEPQASTLVDLFHAQRRLWLIDSVHVSARRFDTALTPYRYRVTYLRRFPGVEPVQVTLVTPRSSSGA
jgi:mannosyltransferase